MVTMATGVVGTNLEWVEQRQVERRRWVTAKKMRDVERTVGLYKSEEESRQVKLSSMLTWDGAVSDWEARRSCSAVACAARFWLPSTARRPRVFFGI